MTAPHDTRRPRLEWLGSRGAGAVVVIVLSACAGFLLVGQAEGPRRPATPLAAESEGDLARILAGLNAEADALQAEIAELRLQLNELRRASEDEASAATALTEQLRSLQVLAGTVPVRGPGITVTISDPARSVTYDAMIDVVQELRDAGAEAIAINQHRVGVSSAFSERGGRVTLDGQELVSPYRVAAIGQPATLDGGLKIPGGAIDTLAALKGVRITVERHARVEIPALPAPPSLEVARPVASRS